MTAELMLDAPFETSRCLAMILAGGEGRRLGPLTLDRAKPAVPFGGKYRIIDIVLSNFVNSGLYRIKILTQYKSASLDEHVARSWRLSPMLDNFIETVPAQQRTGKSWFKGSADAVYQTQHVITDENPDIVCIFGGDHVYKMDVRQMIAAHVHAGSDLTVAAVPIPRHEASHFGVIETDEEGRIRAFHEKVTNPPTLPGTDRCLASMGNYVFKTDALIRELAEDSVHETSAHDFGRDIVPAMVRKGYRVGVYDFATNHVPGEEQEGGYWRDIGTVDAYWEAQMDLVAIQPLFNFYNARWPIRTGISHDPPAKFVFRDEQNARVGIATDSLVSDGCIISGGRLHRTVLSARVRVNSFAEVTDSVIFENVNIGRHARLHRCIIDKDVDIPPGTEIGFDLDRDRQRFYVSKNGIVVVPKRAKLGSLRGGGHIKMGRTIIVGDVHGCREELEELLAKIGFQHGDDRLFLVGDLVARGPDSQGVVALARKLATVALRGNHEDKILRWHVSRRESKPEDMLSEIHRRVVRELRDEDWDFLAQTPLWYDLPEHGVRLVHAGVLPGLAIEKQDAKTLLTVRSISVSGEPLSRPGTPGWADLYVGPPHIVFGHHAQSEPQLQPYATGIDTGCVYGGYLTAVVLHAGERMPSAAERAQILVSFPAKRRYFGKPSADRR